ncbi:hypothetical protein [Neoaquamicrobium microcysteis]
MMPGLFDTVVTEVDGVLCGPARQPRQMLSDQSYAGHASIHDDATARKLGFQGGTIEGPTHFSQFAPLCCSIWGEQWLATGCISVHYRAPSFDGEDVIAWLRRPGIDERQAQIWMTKTDGVEVLRGTVSMEPSAAQTALEERMAGLVLLQDAVILRDVSVGTKVPRVAVRMAPGARMGLLYPFSLADKLRVITEPSPAYSDDHNPWGRRIVPMEMISVLMQHTWDDTLIGVRGPAVGLFADQEIRLLGGPVFVDVPYEVEREVVFLSGSPRTESVWVRTMLYEAGGTKPVAQMLLNCAIMKETYAGYEAEREALYRR